MLLDTFTVTELAEQAWPRRPAARTLLTDGKDGVEGSGRWGGAAGRQHASAGCADGGCADEGGVGDRREDHGRAGGPRAGARADHTRAGGRVPQLDAVLHPGPVHHRLGLVCLGVGLQHGPLPAVGPRTLDHHVAVVISAGRGWFRGADGRTQQIHGPALLWLTPGTPHHYGAHAPDGWDEGFAAFTGSAVAAYTELGCIEPERPVVPLTDAGPARTAIGRIARAARQGNPLLDIEAAAAAHELLVALRRTRADTTRDGAPVLQALARRSCPSPSPTSPPATA